MRRQGRTGGFRPIHDKPHISPLFAPPGESITHSRLLPHLALYSALRFVYSELIDVSQAPASSPAPRRRSRAKDPHPPPSTTARPGRPAPAPEAQGTVRRPAVVIRGVRPLRARPAAPGGSEGGAAARGGRAVVTQVPPGRVAGRQHQGSHGPGSPPQGPEPHHRGGSPHPAPPPQDRDGRARPREPRTAPRTRAPRAPPPAHPGGSWTAAQAARQHRRPRRTEPAGRPTPQPPDPHANTRQEPTTWRRAVPATDERPVRTGTRPHTRAASPTRAGPGLTPGIRHRRNPRPTAREAPRLTVGTGPPHGRPAERRAATGPRRGSTVPWRGHAARAPEDHLPRGGPRRPRAPRRGVRAESGTS